MKLKCGQTGFDLHFKFLCLVFDDKLNSKESELPSLIIIVNSSSCDG